MHSSVSSMTFILFTLAEFSFTPSKNAILRFLIPIFFNTKPPNKIAFMARVLHSTTFLNLRKLGLKLFSIMIVSILESLKNSIHYLKIVLTVLK